MRLAPATLQGRHVRLEPLTIGHAHALAAAGAGPRETYAFTFVPHGLAETEAYIGTALAEQDAGKSMPFATIRVADNCLVGTTRFGNIEHWPWADGSPHQRIVDSCEIGWTWLAADAQRSAINTEAKYLMFSHAFESWNTHRLQLKTDERNWRSRNAIERVGAKFEGILRSVQPASDGNVRSTAFFSITAEEWPAVKAALEVKLAAR
jgi:RimJ/RimL family protein N-acetyltransferase